MTNLDKPRYIEKVGDTMPAILQFGVDGGASKIWEGAMVSVLSTGMAVRAGTSGSGHVKGIATATVDNSAGTDGALSVNLLQGRFFRNNSATTDEITAADIGSVCFAVDDQTVAKTSASGTRAIAGLVISVNDDEGVEVFISAALNASLEVSQAFYGTIDFSLNDFREVTSGGDVGNITANGGLLASDTTPILRGDAAETQEISWAAGNADIIAAHKMVPIDFDGTQDVLVDLFVYTDNAGGSGIDAATFTVETGWDGAALVSDTATDGTPAITMHKVTATVAAADVPNAPSVVTLMLTPAAHAADPTQLLGARILYRRKQGAAA